MSAVVSGWGLAAGCGSGGGPGADPDGTSTYATEAAQSGDAHATTDTGEGTTSSTGDDAADDTGSTTDDGAGDTDGSEGSSGGEPVPPVPPVPPGAYIRGTIELFDGSLVDFDAPAVHEINALSGQSVCEGTAAIDGNAYEVELRWPDTDALELGEQPWSVVSSDGPQLWVGVDGPIGVETSFSTAGWVHFVEVGHDDPPTVAGVAENDLAPDGDDDILLAMTNIVFRCPLDD